MKTFITTIVSGVMTLGLLISALPAQVSAAGAVFNNHAGDYNTVRVSNYSAEPGSSTSWSSNVSVGPDQIVSVGIYYHNNGTETANNTRIRLSPQNSGSANSHTFSATITADNASPVSGSAGVSIVDGPEALNYVATAVYWYPNQCNSNSCRQTLPFGQNGSEIFTTTGLRIGNITAGWGSQGGVVVHFRSTNNGGGSSNQNQPQATTNNATNIYDDSATLNGTYAMNGVSGQTWFEWGTSSTNLNNQTNYISRSANTSGTMNATITGLNSDYTYYFRACVRHNSGTYAGTAYCGSIRQFTTGDDNNNYNDAVDVDTRQATNVQSTSATLVGRLNDVGAGGVRRWFEWGTSSNSVSNGNGSQLSISGTTNSTGEFNRSLNGLNQNTTYYFRACAEDSDGDQDCGPVRNFRTDNGYVNQDERPTVTTLAPVGVGATYATCNGYYSANGSATDVWFEWGTTTSLGSTTLRQGKGNSEGGMTSQLTGLSSNTTYYCRAVAQNAYGTSYGSVVSFRTISGGIIVPPTTVITNNVSGGAGTFLRLQIENGVEYIQRGDRLVYDVEWENISGRNLENLVIKIDMPNQLVVLDSSEGRISKRDNAVVLNIGTLDRGETGNMTVTARVKSGRDGDPIVAQATGAFDHPTIKEKTQINAIAYDSDTYDAYRAGLGASLFGLFDGNILGLLLILLLLILIVLIARKQYMDNKEKKAGQTPVAPVAPAANTSEYRPYRPTPIQ